MALGVQCGPQSLLPPHDLSYPPSRASNPLCTALLSCMNYLGIPWSYWMGLDTYPLCIEEMNVHISTTQQQLLKSQQRSEIAVVSAHTVNLGDVCWALDSTSQLQLSSVAPYALSQCVSLVKRNSESDWTWRKQDSKGCSYTCCSIKVLTEPIVANWRRQRHVGKYNPFLVLVGSSKPSPVLCPCWIICCPVRITLLGAQILQCWIYYRAKETWFCFKEAECK